ncbi:hypothetical protein OA93_08070 [Flavobacterium sp. KMS]|nr:hypothetical protein OA93_08070 [Flavobacterium sp. KMS]
MNNIFQYFLEVWKFGFSVFFIKRPLAINTIGKIKPIKLSIPIIVFFVIVLEPELSKKILFRV